jgi:hypothetical protein
MLFQSSRFAVAFAAGGLSCPTAEVGTERKPRTAKQQMPEKTTNALSSLGFFTVCEQEDQSLFGGLLVLNLAGRPLEFHCTAPVRPNRAQEILYGPTLRPYLYGEQIGRALMERVSATPALLFTDVEPALALRPLTTIPVVLVPPDGGAERAAPAANPAANSTVALPRLDAPHPTPAPAGSTRLHRFTLGVLQLAVPLTHPDDESRVVSQWEPHADEFDLTEPFGRIREAIEEARRAAR